MLLVLENSSEEGRRTVGGGHPTASSTFPLSSPRAHSSHSSEPVGASVMGHSLLLYCCLLWVAGRSQARPSAACEFISRDRCAFRWCPFFEFLADAMKIREFKCYPWCWRWKRTRDVQGICNWLHCIWEVVSFFCFFSELGII